MEAHSWPSCGGAEAGGPVGAAHGLNTPPMHTLHARMHAPTATFRALAPPACPLPPASLPTLAFFSDAAPTGK